MWQLGASKANLALLNVSLTLSIESMDEINVHVDHGDSISGHQQYHHEIYDNQLHNDQQHHEHCSNEYHPD